jgi:DNA-binding PadR family transcriptional regulator
MIFSAYFKISQENTFFQVGGYLSTLFHDRIAAMTTPTPDETILGILSAKPQHGYQLLEYFNQRQSLGRVWSMSTSQIYAVLKRLETAGLVVGETVEAPDAPPRTEYTITSLGNARLHAWLYDQEPSASIRRVRIEFISKLYVARLLGLSVTEIVQYQKGACQRQKQSYLHQNENGNHLMDRMVVEFIIGQLDAALAWLDQCEAHLPELG